MFLLPTEKYTKQFRQITLFSKDIAKIEQNCLNLTNFWQEKGDLLHLNFHA